MPTNFNSSNNNFVPETIQELESWMKENCFNFNSYSINGNSIFEGYGIQQSDDQFIWFYTERGQQDNLQYFQSEKEIVVYAFHEISLDKWAKTHCVGFTALKDERLEIARILSEMNIEYFQDETPHYYSTNISAYRTFVMGCDIQRTIHVKERYYKK